jgi:hypothetical protein
LIPVVVCDDQDTIAATVVREGLDANLDERRHGNVENTAAPREPGIGPAAVVRDADRRARDDDA